MGELGLPSSEIREVEGFSQPNAQNNEGVSQPYAQYEHGSELQPSSQVSHSPSTSKNNLPLVIPVLVLEDIHENAFIHVDLEEEVYMELPPGYEMQNNAVTGDDTEEMERLQEYLSSEFEMKDLGGLKYFLGIEVAHSRDGAPRKGLIFRKHGHMEVKWYTNVDGAGNITDRRSTSGYFTFVAGNLMTWRSKKQNVVARSTVEAEYHGMAHGICELLWLRIILTEIGFKPHGAMFLYCDNQAA
ncbi:uncharacterized protein [Pyrus communis]|uniref:uncharacterized protein n=1 Tax=Pyrus communis TaxID=23211 RepID=UPI0035BF05B6